MNTRINTPLSCNHPDRDIPKIKCGYPLPCPWHTVVIDLSEEPHQVVIPLENKKALSKSDVLLDIGRALVVPKNKKAKRRP